MKETMESLNPEPEENPPKIGDDLDIKIALRNLDRNMTARMFQHIARADFDPGENVQSLLEIYKDKLDRWDRVGEGGMEDDSEEELSLSMQAVIDLRALVQDGIIKESMTVSDVMVALKRKFSATFLEEYAKFNNDQEVVREMMGLGEDLGYGALRWDLSRSVLRMLETMELPSSEITIQQLLAGLYISSKTKKDKEALTLLTKIEDLIRMKVLRPGMKIAAVMKKLDVIVNEVPTFPEDSGATSSVKPNKKVK